MLSPGMSASLTYASTTGLGFGRRHAGQQAKLVDLAFEQPVLNARLVEVPPQITRPAALTGLRQLAELDVLVEVGEGPRGQLRWRAQEILAVLVED